MKKISRRSFLAVCGAMAATAALTACGGSSASTAGTAASGSTAEYLDVVEDDETLLEVSKLFEKRLSDQFEIE